MFGPRKTLISLAVLAALSAPVALHADDHHDHDRDHRFYDRDHKDYHRWDDHERNAYRRWTDENHRRYTDFNHLSRQDQQRYWAWRHNHPDAR